MILISTLTKKDGEGHNSRYATPELQTIELQQTDKGKCKTWFQIVL